MEANPKLACLKDIHKSLVSGFSKWSLRSPVQKSLKTRSLGSGLTSHWLLGSFGIALVSTLIFSLFCCALIKMHCGKI